MTWKGQGDYIWVEAIALHTANPGLPCGIAYAPLSTTGDTPKEETRTNTTGFDTPLSLIIYIK